MFSNEQKNPIYSLVQRAILILKKEGLKSLLTKSANYIGINKLINNLIKLIIEVCRNNIKQKEELVLFGSKRGFEGNSRWIFEWICENESDITPIWIANNSSTYSEVASQGFPVIKAQSIQALIQLVYIKTVVVNHGYSDIAFNGNVVPESITSINVSHGANLVRDYQLPDRNRDPEIPHDYSICTSRTQKKHTLWKYYGKIHLSDIPRDIRSKFKVTGFPKTDILIDTPKESEQNWSNFHKGSIDEFIVLYAPTGGRKDVDDDEPQKNLFPFSDFNHDDLFTFLEENNIRLYLRPHPTDVKNMKRYNYGSNALMSEQIKKLVNGSDNISLATNDEISVVQLLPFVDVLFTDYSTIFVEFLALDRPIIFISDSCLGGERINFALKFDNYRAGPEVNSFAEFKKLVLEAKLGNDLLPKKRKKVQNKYYEHIDCSARKRVVELIKSTL